MFGKIEFSPETKEDVQNKTLSAPASESLLSVLFKTLFKRREDNWLG
jgi:hypothetical protein|tara:strand:+ start:268 stop:408 length:141 start_codon:yes stop_codon:yes gene_type:complete